MEYLKKRRIEINKTTTITQLVKGLFILIFLLLLSFYVVYFTSQTIAKIYFLLLLFLFFFLKKDYFWFAYFFIVTQGPGHFFADFQGSSLYRLPLYSFFPGMAFTPLDFFVLLAFLKALIAGKKIKLQLEKPLLLLLIYIIFVLSVNSFLFGTNADILAWNLRWFFYYSIVISFLYLVNKKHEVYRFIFLVSPVVFFILFAQLYFMAAGNEFINLFDPGFRGVSLNSVTGELRPVMGGVLIVFFSFIFSFFLLENRDCKLPKIYLYLIVGAAFLSVFLSATRLWFVIFSFIFLCYMVVSRKKIVSTMGIVAIFFLIISVLSYFGVVPLDIAGQNSWMRLQQIFDVARGNIYSVDTAMYRLVNQFPILLGVIKQNPLTGYGFSQVTMIYYDNDFGFLNTILMYGVLGFFLFIFFFINLFKMLQSSVKKIQVSNSFKVPLKIMVIAWAGLLIGYFTTWDFFSMESDKVFFVSILIVFTEFFVVQADKEEMLLQYQNIEGAQSM